MRLFFLLLPLLSVLQFNTTSPRNSTAPYISSVLEQLDGSKVSVRFRAVHWDPITTDAVFEDDDTRDYYNHYILTKVGTLENNVQLAIGPHRLNPGSYYLGVEALKDQSGIQNQKEAVFLISDENNVLMRIPVVLTVEDVVSSHLSVVFLPGVTDRDFVFSAMFGNLSLLMKFRFSGVPARPAEAAALRASGSFPNPTAFPTAIGIRRNQMDNASMPDDDEIDDATSNVRQRSGLGAVQPMPGNAMILSNTMGGTNMMQGMGATARIDNATEMNTRRRAGSGAFRIMKIRPQN